MNLCPYTVVVHHLQLKTALTTPTRLRCRGRGLFLNSVAGVEGDGRGIAFAREREQ
jgi:hypothetical protein